MAIKHLNPSAKEESGILLSGRDAKKVFSMFQNKREKTHIHSKQASLQSLFNRAITISTTRKAKKLCREMEQRDFNLFQQRPNSYSH